MSYSAPVREIAHTLDGVAGLGSDIAAGLCGDLASEIVGSILEEAGKFSSGTLAPINRQGDLEGARYENGVVTMPVGWPGIYRAWSAAGWNSVDLPTAWGGMGLPTRLAAACMEMWTSACMSFALGPVLTQGAVDLLERHASADLKALYLPKLVTGEWAATMCLTEPQAGSDLGALRSKAEPAGDGTYRVSGQKIFITYGEHDLTDNIIHLVLARLQDAPVGTRGLSLFLVPKVLGADDSAPGRLNDVRCTGIEHKLGIHGSPTCTMAFGDGGGATGWLVGEEHRGLACMFTMMNKARLFTGLQGVAIAERAYQTALAYAKMRKQGRAAGSGTANSSLIIEHADVRRNLLTMKALTAAARAIAYAAAQAIDHAHGGSDPTACQRAEELAGLLTPVTKAWCSDVGVEVASLGLQVHGGMGYVEETGVAQHYRNSRITPIYEGANGIQAIDLVTRKALRGEDATIRRLIADFRGIGEQVSRIRDDDFRPIEKAITVALDDLDTATAWLLAEGRSAEEQLAVATPYLRLLGTAAGAAYLGKGAIAAYQRLATGSSDQFDRDIIVTARFFADNIAVSTGSLARVVMTSAAGLAAAARLSDFAV